MTDRIGTLHRILLWASLLLLAALGTAFLLVPDTVLSQRGVEGLDGASGVFRVASSVLLAEAVVIALALRSGSWSETRYVTYLLAIHFTVETAVRIALFATGDSGSLVAAVPQAVIATGLLFEISRRRAASATRMAAASPRP
jgi:hypothetical protein